MRLGTMLAAVLLATLAPVAAAPPGERIANAEAARWYRDGAAALFVDLRSERERAQDGRLARALWLSTRAAGEVSGTAFADRVVRAANGDPSRPIVLVCREGIKASSAAAALRAHGFPRVLVVEGGLWAGEPWLAFELE